MECLSLCLRGRIGEVILYAFLAGVLLHIVACLCLLIGWVVVLSFVLVC